MVVDFEEIARKWQRRWKEAKVFEAKVEEGRKKFYITVPYPYASGPLHIGHGRTYTVGDIVARYRRMKGYNVLFPMAFHVTGTPVLAIADEIGRGDEKTISLYKDYVRIYESDEDKVEEIVESFKDPKNIAEFFASRIQEDFEGIGYSIDWRRKFNTAEPIYNRFVEWQFKKLYEKGVIVKGSYPITYSPVDESAVGEDDIEDGDVNKVSVMEFTGIKFRYGDGYIVCATLRPETIFGVTNIWINPSGVYVKASVDGEILYISKECAEKLRYQKENVEILEEIKGEEFVGKFADEPVAGRKIPILPAKFVDVDNASGIVYSVPAHAPYDYQALVDIQRNPPEGLEEIVKNIVPIKIIDIEGYGEYPAKDACEKLGVESQEDYEKLEEATNQVYRDEFYKGILNERCGKFAGMRIRDIKDEVKNFLKERNAAIVIYETSRKAVTRAGNKVIVAVLRDQWFLDYSPRWWKDLGHKAVDRMLFLPEKYRENMHEIIEWLQKRPCARKRGLGTRLPFDRSWIIESLSDSTIYMAFYTIAHIIRRNNISEDSLTEEFFDYVFLGKGNADDVADKTGIDRGIIEEMRREFTYWYPNDQRHTAPAHLSNHLAFFIMHHTAIFPEEYWPRGITLNGLMIREGAKISKSKGNAIPLAHISKLYGVDTFRLYVVGASDLDSVMDWREAEVNSVRKKLQLLAEIWEDSIGENEPEELKSVDKYLISRFYRRLREADRYYENMEIRKVVVELFYNMLNDVKYYEKRMGPDRRRKVVKIFLEDWIKALSPIIPHLSEEYWERMGKDGFVSLAEFPEVREEYIDDSAEAEVEYIENLIEDVKHVLSLKKGGEKLYVYTSPVWMRRAIELLKEGKSRGEVIKTLISEGIDGKVAANFITKVLKDRIHEKYIPIDEERVLRENSEYILRETGLREIVINGEHDPAKRKDRALPLKPGIYVE